MKKKLPLIILLIALNVCVVQANQESQFDVGRLSEKGRLAYQKLLSAIIFRVGGVGSAGEISPEELALHVLLDEKEATEAFRSLARDGSYEGGLYGLLGLSITNVDAFNRAVDEYKSRSASPERKAEYRTILKGQVFRQRSCEIFEEDWLKVVRDIQSGKYTKVLRRGKG